MKGEYDKVIADCTAAIRLDPKNAEMYKLRGEANRLKHEYDKAISDYTEGIRLNSRETSACDSRNNGHRIQSGREKVFAELTKAILFNSNVAYYGRGLAYHAKGDYGNAIADFTVFIDCDRYNPEGYLKRANAYRKSGDNAKADEDIAQAKKLGYKEKKD